MLSSEIKQVLRASGIRLNTDSGQHFLIDAGVLERIVSAAKLASSDHVVEIGPGIGVLTRELLKRAGKVTAIELDARFIPILRQFAHGGLKNEPGAEQRLKVIRGNALQVPLPVEPYKIVANIPYHITSPLLRHVFLESQRWPSSLTLLVQEEVAVRIASNEDRGLLSILVQLFGEPTLVATVPPTAFLPPPKVDSAVLHIECFREPRASRGVLEQIFKLTKIAFGQKRKMLSNTLGALSGGTEAMEKVGIDLKRRPQTLKIEEWIGLAREFVKSSSTRTP